MDTFTLIVFGGLAVVLLTLLFLGRFSGRRTRDITHQGDQAAVAARLAVEERDIPEMVDAQNEYRRRTGRASGPSRTCGARSARASSSGSTGLTPKFAHVRVRPWL
jgi:hypothetical protein